jgi:hypothetical protein
VGLYLKTGKRLARWIASEKKMLVLFRISAGGLPLGSFAQKLRSGFRLSAQTPAIWSGTDPSPSAQDFACGLPFGYASLTPAVPLKMQRGTFDGSLAVRSLSKAPRCAPLRLVLCNSILFAILETLKIKELGELLRGKEGRISLLLKKLLCGFF